MNVVLCFFGLFATTFIIYLCILYGLYIPSKTRYIPSTCKYLNATHSSAFLQCKKVVFNKRLSGECFYDIVSKNISSFHPDWNPLLIITGTITSIFFILFILSFFWFQKKPVGVQDNPVGVQQETSGETS